MNSVNLVGRITKDPQVNKTQSGMSYMRFSLAVDRQQKEAQADFIPCVAMGQQADFIGNYIKKGYRLAIVGKIQTNSYTDKDGKNQYSVDVYVDRVENLTPKETSNPQPTYQQPTYNQQAPSQPQYQPPSSFNITEDDVPF